MKTKNQEKCKLTYFSVRWSYKITSAHTLQKKSYIYKAPPLFLCAE